MRSSDQVSRSAASEWVSIRLATSAAIATLIAFGCERIATTDSPAVSPVSSVMYPVHLDLQEGFDQDSVVLYLNEEEILSERFTTDFISHLATARTVFMPGGDYILSVAGDLGNSVTPVEIEAEQWIGINYFRDEQRFEFLRSDTEFVYSSFSGRFLYLGFGPDSMRIADGYLTILQADSSLSGQRDIIVADTLLPETGEVGRGPITGQVYADWSFSLNLNPGQFPAVMIKGVFRRQDEYFYAQRLIVDSPGAFPVAAGYCFIQRSCTSLGGTRAYILDITPRGKRFVPGLYSVSVTPQGDTTRFCSFRVSDSYSVCASGHCVSSEDCNAIYIVGYPMQDKVSIWFSIFNVPISARVDLDGAAVGVGTFLPVYETTFPNGLGCSGSGFVATAELVLDR